MTRAQAVAQASREIDLNLQLHGEVDEHVNLPPAIHQLSELQCARGAFDRVEQRTYADNNGRTLTQEQRQIYSMIINSVYCNTPGAYIACRHQENVYRKRYCSAIMREWAGRSDGRVDYNCSPATGGWTAHSMFELPLKKIVVPGVLCNIRGESERA